MDDATPLAQVEAPAPETPRQLIAPLWHTILLVLVILLVSFGSSKAVNRDASASKLPLYAWNILWQWLVVGYAVLIALWHAVRVLLRDRLWPLAIINTAAEYLAVPLLPLVVIALISPRRWSLLGVLVIPALVFLWLFGELFLPRSQSAPAGPRLKIMTYNVLFSNEDFDAIANSIRAASPDIIGFEELTGAHEVV